MMSIALSTRCRKPSTRVRERERTRADGLRRTLRSRITSPPSGVAMHPIRAVEGRQVELRSLDETHAEGPYLAWLQDKEVTRFLEARFIDYDADKLRRYIRAENERSNAVLFG